MYSRHAASCVALLLLFTTSAAAGDPPIIHQYYADHTEIVRGQRVELHWHTTHATRIEIEPLGVRRIAPLGSTYFWPEETGTYELRAINAYGTSTAQVTVTISKQFDIVSFTSSHDLVGTQDAVILTWQVFGVGEVTLDGEGPLPMSGSLTDIPHETHSYLLEVRSGDEYQSASVDVQVSGEWKRSRFLLSYADDAVDTRADSYIPFTQIPIYVLGESLDGFGLAGVEFGLDISSDLALMDVDFHSWRAINVLSEPDFVVGLGACFQTEPLHVIATLQVMAMNQLAIDQGELRLRPAWVASVPGTVAYATCEFDLEGSEISHPLSAALIGPPLYLSAERVPVLRLNLRAQREPGAVRLRWDEVSLIGADRFQLLRERDGQPTQLADGAVAEFFPALEFRDANAPDGALNYRLRLYAGEELLVEELAKLDDWQLVPVRSALLQNAPNPFNPSTTLRWSAAVPGRYELRVVNASGRLVRAFDFAIATPGAQETFWDGRDQSGRLAASGVYHLLLIAPDARDERRVVLLK